MRPPDLRAQLAADVAGLDRELSEIDLLIQQVALEAERHETRRSRAEDRASALERDPQSSLAELNEAHANLLTFTKRAMLFEAQREVLEGKQKTLRRFRDRLAQVADAVAVMPPPMPFGPPVGPPPGALPQRPPPDAVANLRHQEALRREIVRQLHDGPAQSLANIALQAEIVQRLVGRDDNRAQTELVSMRKMVQHALDTTKEFIFDVRPMVLDDLGLTPTIRRAAADRARRSGVSVDFDSHGHDRRLSPDLESGLFRSVDEAMAGYAGLRPQGIVVRLDWSEIELVATVEATWPPAAPGTPAPARSAPVAPGSMPPALAAMIEEKRSSDQLARSQARSLPPDRLAEIGDRARALGVRMAVRDEGRLLELVARIPA